MKFDFKKYDTLYSQVKLAERPVVFINVCTHGHEQVGISVIEALNKMQLQRGTLITNIANERAVVANVPYIESDLNRVFPGKKNGTYEEQLAYHIHPLILASDVVIDIHSTETTKIGKSSAIIITKLNKETRQLIEVVQPPKVILMSHTKNNALISSAKVGIGIEYGEDKDASTRDRIINDIAVLMEELNMLKNVGVRGIWKKKTEWYEALNIIKRERGCIQNKNIKNFKLLRVGSVIAECTNKKILAEVDFYPILFGRNRYTNIFGFVGRKINFDNT